MTILDVRMASNQEISLRRAELHDAEFLVTAYASTRRDELASSGWGPSMSNALLTIHFQAQWRACKAVYPSVQTSIILACGTPIGSMMVQRTKSEARLVDIVLLPEHRNRGIGALLVRRLIAESIELQIPLRLSVLKSDRAIHLFERLGLGLTSCDELHCEMAFEPAKAKSAASR
jgi:ribosomal protein S18 acetylase RimI-like enzyme